MSLFSLEIDGLAAIFGWIGDHATVLSAVIAAIATGFIAYFTITLARASVEQSRFTRESIELTTKEFVATHRPKIIVRGLELQNPEFQDGDRIEGWFIAQNIGETPAHIWEINTRMVLVNANRLRGGIPLSHRTEYDITLGSGEPSEMFLFDSIIAGTGMPMSIFADEHWLICLGQVRYRDDNGTERETGFARRWVGRTNTWERLKDTDYEYEY